MDNSIIKKIFLYLLLVTSIISVILLYSINYSPTEPGFLHLSDINPISSSQGYGSLSRDLSVDGNSIFIGGRFFSRGLGTHSNSEIVYDVSGFNASRFVSWVGVDDEVTYGSVVFKVYGDGKLLYKSPLLKRGEGPELVDVDVEGIQTIKLEANDGADMGGVGDHADWGDAKLAGENYSPEIISPPQLSPFGVGGISLLISRLIILLPLILLSDALLYSAHKLNLKKTEIVFLFMLLAVLVLQCVLSMSYENLTFDENGHIGGGYSYLKFGEFRVGELSSMEHPPLVRSIGASPLLFMKNVTYDTSDPDWFHGSVFKVGDRLIYAGDKMRTEKIIFFTRLSIVFLSVFLALYVFLWSTRLYGVYAGFFSLILYVFNPNILANSRLVTTDLGGTCFIFISLYYLWNFLKAPSRWNLLLSGVSLGFAVISKATGILLLPVFFVFFFTHFFSAEKSVRKRVTDFIRQMTVFSVIVLLVVNSSYGFKDILRPVASLQFTSTALKKVASTTLRFFPVPLPASYVLGIDYSLRHSERGHPSVFMGKVSGHGSKYYYPVVFLVKNPIPLLLLIVFSILSLNHKARLFDEFFLVFPVIFFFLVFSRNHTNIGLRHILPVFPLIFVYLGRLVKSRFNKPVLILLCLWYAYSSLGIFPHYLAYFNELAGGPDNGYKISVFADLDWGQDMKGLAAYVHENNISEIYYSKYGTADTQYYGLSYTPLPCNKIRGLIAIHVANLMRDPDCNGWLKAYEPKEKIGYSIFIYNITE